MPTDHASKARVAPPRERFVLSGHSASIDRRVDVVRDDLADVMLADRVFAPHYARALSCITVRAVSILAAPHVDGPVVDRLGVGATLELFDISGGWAWVRTGNAVGYVRADCVAPS